MIRLVSVRLRHLRPVLAAVLAVCFALAGVAPLEPAQACRSQVHGAFGQPDHAAHGASLAGMLEHAGSSHRHPAPRHHALHQDCCLASACCLGVMLGTAVAFGHSAESLGVMATPTAVPARAPAAVAHLLPFATAPPLSLV